MYLHFGHLRTIQYFQVREADLSQPEYDYTPDILKDGFVQPRIIPENNATPLNTKREIIDEHDENYGTFQEETHVQINEEDDQTKNSKTDLEKYA